jgi:hypothetical protein
MEFYNKIPFKMILKGFKLSCMILLLSTATYSQTLNPTVLKLIYQNDIEYANDLLTRKGFEFYTSEENENGDLSTTWTLKRNNFTKRAVKFIAKSCQKKNCGIVWYQINSIDEFNNSKNFAKTLGYKLINTYRDELGSLNFEYTNKIYKIKFSQGLSEETSNNLYFITFGKYYNN